MADDEPSVALCHISELNNLYNKMALAMNSGTTESLAMAKIYDLALERYRRILNQREEILTAFVAKYGCQPEDIIQVIQTVDKDTQIFYVTQRKPIDQLKDLSASVPE